MRSKSYHPGMRRTKKVAKRRKPRSLKAEPLKRRDQERVKGGIDVVKTPSPAGPIPIPYPNVAPKPS
jgi:hypothetical protein